MTDFLNVKALRTFAIGKDLKTKRSDFFAVESGEARLLEAQGLVEVVDGAGAINDETETETETETAEIPITKRKGKANVDDKNT